ncbi:hypothetical protein BUPH_08453 (plasmid) [Paraburkholderia phenoliruptrix BR3459a]|uniref:Uncharacterized protein n=1 Tax=Paraburkholderia phenoliruptrix BR3459a TaxID=1229205 RepID=K0DW46_9BURK|nr:hypothetical protein BUPH_08453 [Paraburkholderia phenoliruptrix BR3459a]
MGQKKGQGRSVESRIYGTDLVFYWVLRTIDAEVSSRIFNFIASNPSKYLQRRAKASFVSRLCTPDGVYGVAAIEA